MKNERWLSVAVLSVFAGSNCLGAIDGALSMISESLQVSQTTALYVGSVATLACMVSGVVFGAVAGKKLPYKRSVLLCYLLAIFFGTTSVFVPSFPALLGLRCLFGFGVGGIMCIQTPIATLLIREDRRAQILGLGTCIAFGTQSVMQLVGGILADIHWNWVFLTYLILILPLGMVIFLLPEIPAAPPSEEKQNSGKLPLGAIVMCVILGIVWLNIAPLLFGSAFYAAAVSDRAVIAAVLAMMFSFGCMGGGLLFSTLRRAFGRHSFPAFLLIAGAGLGISAASRSLIPMCAGFLLGGIGQSCMQAGIMLYLGQTCDRFQIGRASALMTVCLNLGAFSCSAWDALLGRFTGDTLYFPLYLGALTFAVIATGLFFHERKTRER